MKKFLILCITVIFFAACNQSNVFEKHHELKDNKWLKTEIITFQVEIENPDNYDIIIAIRHASFYPFANVLMGLTIETPEGESRFMQHDLIIRNTDGSFKGEGLGDIWDIELPVFENFPFSQKGNYTFKIENKMHLVEIIGLMEIGLIIKKIN
ncbi:MAG: gliding motility lipoprotein GldH [Bacteroidales bacterium]|nr:gliding motility lipoprotein GldH [Bacteroidales bacterium]